MILFRGFDLDLDGKFNEKELKLIEDALIAYLEPKNFLTTITYAPLVDENETTNQEPILNENVKKESNKFQVKNYKMVFKDSVLSFDYSIDLNYMIKTLYSFIFLIMKITFLSYLMKKSNY